MSRIRRPANSTEPAICVHAAPKYPSLQQEFLFGDLLLILFGAG
jgi:hypothetical protein